MYVITDTAVSANCHLPLVVNHSDALLMVNVVIRLMYLETLSLVNKLQPLGYAIKCMGIPQCKRGVANDVWHHETQTA